MTAKKWYVQPQNLSTCVDAMSISGENWESCCDRDRDGLGYQNGTGDLGHADFSNFVRQNSICEETWIDSANSGRC